MDYDGFQKTCIERYGDKVNVSKILNVSEDVREKKGDEFADAIIEYPAQVWLKPSDDVYHCPECNAEISGLFGRVAWGIIHGVCYCTACESVSFAYYHYPLEGSNERFCAFALHAIPRKVKK